MCIEHLLGAYETPGLGMGYSPVLGFSKAPAGRQGLLSLLER